MGGKKVEPGCVYKRRSVTWERGKSLWLVVVVYRSWKMRDILCVGEREALDTSSLRDRCCVFTRIWTNFIFESMKRTGTPKEIYGQQYQAVDLKKKINRKVYTRNPSFPWRKKQRKMDDINMYNWTQQRVIKRKSVDCVDDECITAVPTARDGQSCVFLYYSLLESWLHTISTFPISYRNDFGMLLNTHV